jgi:N-acetylmuramoyl-L-alanine amidase
MVIGSLSLSFIACQKAEKPTERSELADLNELSRVYVTVASTRVRTGPGPQFRAIAEIPREAKINVVGRDGDWVLIVSKKGNAPGFIEIASVKRWDGEANENLDPRAEGRYEAVAATQVRSGPGLHYPVVASISKGTKLNVVDEDKGWLKVESKRGNKPGYVEASLTKPAAGE